MQDWRWLKDLWQGKKAIGQNTERATALPATGNLFTVSGGRILVTAVVGEFTAVADANATSASLLATPTQGTARALCTPTNIASYAIGDLLGITGVPTDALMPAVTSGVIPGQTMGVIVKPGVISMLVAAPGQVTARVRWTLKWQPIDATASVAAA